LRMSSLAHFMSRVFTRVFCTSTKMASDASTADSSSTARTVMRVLPPAPPCVSGISIPIRPSSKHWVSRAGSSAAARSMAGWRGVMYDSLISGAPLAGAGVWIQGTNRTARTDAAGRFELTALAAGHYRLSFDHPLLDSIGVAAPPVVVDVVAGGATAVSLATP